MKRWNNPYVVCACLALGLSLGLLGCGDSEPKGTSEDSALEVEVDFSPVIARIGDTKITQGYFDYRYENLPPADKVRYTGEGWENRFLKKLIEETLIYEQAKDEGFQNQKEIDWRLDMAARSILFKAYYNYHFKDHLVVPEEKIKEHYEQNQDAYRSFGRALAAHIQCSSKERIDAAAAELAAGGRFAVVAGKYSEDETTKNDGGLLGWFNPDGYVLGMGFNKEFTDYAFNMGTGTSNPVKIGDNWHIIQVKSLVPGGQQSYEDAHDRVEREVRPALVEESYKQRLKELTDNFGVEIFGDYDTRETRSAEQLYQLAGESRDPHARVEYYDSLVQNYPDHELADDALFMKGFIESEEFGEVGVAREAFRQLIETYPKSQWVESARWLLQNVGRTSGSLRGSALPADGADIEQRIQEKRQ